MDFSARHDSSKKMANFVAKYTRHSHQRTQKSHKLLQICMHTTDLPSSWKRKNKDRLQQPTAPQHNYGS